MLASRPKFTGLDLPEVDGFSQVFKVSMLFRRGFKLWVLNLTFSGLLKILKIESSIFKYPKKSSSESPNATIGIMGIDMDRQFLLPLAIEDLDLTTNCWSLFHFSADKK